MQQKNQELTPHNFASRCYQTQFTDIHLIFKERFISDTDHNTKQTSQINNISSQSYPTSMTVPLVITPREVYIGPLGFFFTPMISRLKVHLSSGWVTWALVKRKPEGRMNLSYLGGFLVKPGPTNVAFVTILFHCLAAKVKTVQRPLGVMEIISCKCTCTTKNSPQFPHTSEWQTETSQTIINTDRFRTKCF